MDLYTYVSIQSITENDCKTGSRYYSQTSSKRWHKYNVARTDNKFSTSTWLLQQWISVIKRKKGENSGVLGLPNISRKYPCRGSKNSWGRHKYFWSYWPVKTIRTLSKAWIFRTFFSFFFFFLNKCSLFYRNEGVARSNWKWYIY